MEPALADNLMRLIAEGAGEEDEAADAELRAQAVSSYLTLLEKPNLPDILLQACTFDLDLRCHSNQYPASLGQHLLVDARRDDEIPFLKRFLRVPNVWICTTRQKGVTPYCCFAWFETKPHSSNKIQGLSEQF